ncbi:ribonuclease III domain-containing protein [Xylariales sp. AK1849]|nr:ribonuclease III domain-containing protein [Xylariales sp. AK1849]
MHCAPTVLARQGNSVFVLLNGSSSHRESSLERNQGRKPLLTMSKRPFSEITQDVVSTYEAVSQIIQQGEDLLRAAQALKQNLDAGNHQNDETTSHLISISSKILPSVERFGRYSTPSHKVPRLEGNQPQTSSLRIPSFVALTPWSPDDIPTYSPPLPPILDPVLGQAAFTHSGMVSKCGEISYERLEWIGDAYLYVMASAFIYQTFPNLSPGRCTQHRELLVKNMTLAKYSMEYGLNQRTRFPADFDLHGRIGGNEASQAKKKKVLGDVFEAYVAGVILGDAEKGLSRVSAWMKSLWSKELADEIKKECARVHERISRAHKLASHVLVASTEAQPQQELNPKVQLQQKIGGKGIDIKYLDVGSPGKEKNSSLPWYTVGVYLHGWGEKGFRMGLGSSVSKKEAGSKAAEAALNNKKMMNGLEQKKKDFRAAFGAQKEYADWEP